jgi:hypothetical protein
MAPRPSALALLACASLFPVARAQFVQQGNKLVGTGYVGYPEQGDSPQTVALSADGNTALVGGWTGTGAVWVFTRSAGVWSQQGGELVGSGAVGPAGQGIAIALSADGNTAIVGGFIDNAGIGAAWIWTRSGGIWTQQDPKLVGAGAVGTSSQGIGVALSADGNTALVGGPGDNNSAGAAWVWTRSGGVWTQQGPKLVGTGSAGPAGQGDSVALSADGNTALVGGPSDGGIFSGPGAVWVWVRSAGVWTQQGAKLVNAGGTDQGVSLALSADGNTGIVGSQRALWVWTRSGGTWSPQAGPLVGTDASTNHFAAEAVALSGDGNTAVAGSSQDANAEGAIWVWTRSGSTWTQQGAKLVGAGAVPDPSRVSVCQCILQGSSVAISVDGSTIIEGGPDDSGGIGAAWVFVRQAALPTTPAPATILMTLTGLAALALLFRSLSRVT